MADALSCMPQFHSKRDDVIQAMIPDGTQGGRAATSTDTQRGWEDSLREALTTDKWIQDNRHLLTHRDGLAWKGDRLYIPNELQRAVLQRCHDVKASGHFGFLKTLHFTRRQFWWPHMRADIEAYVTSCTICAKSKSRPGKPLGLLQSVATPSRPWDEIIMDFVVDLPECNGNTVIWTIIDLFSKQAHFVPCRGLPSAWKLARLFIQHIYRLHRVPRVSFQIGGFNLWLDSGEALYKP